MVLGRAVRLGGGGEGQKSTPPPYPCCSTNDLALRPKASPSLRQSNVFLVAPFEFNAPRWRDFTRDRYASRQQKLLATSWTVKSAHGETLSASSTLEDEAPSEKVAPNTDSSDSHDSDWFNTEHPEHEASSEWPWPGEAGQPGPDSLDRDLLPSEPAAAWMQNMDAATPNARLGTMSNVSSSPLSCISEGFSRNASRKSSLALSIITRDSLFEEEPKPSPAARHSQRFLLSRLKPQRNLRKEDPLANSENLPPLPFSSASTAAHAARATVRQGARAERQEDEGELSFHSQLENSFSNSFEKEFYLTPVRDSPPMLKKPCLLSRPPLRAIRPLSPADSRSNPSSAHSAAPQPLAGRAVSRPLLKATASAAKPAPYHAIASLSQAAGPVATLVKPGLPRKKEVKIDDLKLLLEQYNNKVRPNRRKKPG